MAQIKSSYFRERAAECGEQVKSVTLENVRRKIVASQTAWQLMADSASEREKAQLSQPEEK